MPSSIEYSRFEWEGDGTTISATLSIPENRLFPWGSKWPEKGATVESVLGILRKDGWKPIHFEFGVLSRNESQGIMQRSVVVLAREPYFKWSFFFPHLVFWLIALGYLTFGLWSWWVAFLFIDEYSALIDSFVTNPASDKTRSLQFLIILLDGCWLWSLRGGEVLDRVRRGIPSDVLVDYR